MNTLVQRLRRWFRPVRSAAEFLFASVRLRRHRRPPVLDLHSADRVRVTTLSLPPLAPGVPNVPPEIPLSSSDLARIRAIARHHHTSTVPDLCGALARLLHENGATGVALRAEPDQDHQPAYLTVAEPSDAGASSPSRG